MQAKSWPELVQCRCCAGASSLGLAGLHLTIQCQLPASWNASALSHHKSQGQPTASILLTRAPQVVAVRAACDDMNCDLQARVGIQHNWHGCRCSV